MVMKKSKSKSKLVSRTKTLAEVTKAKGRLYARDLDRIARGDSTEQILAPFVLEPITSPRLDKGQKLLVRAAKRLVESRLESAFQEPVSKRSTLIRYEDAFISEDLSDGEKDLHTALDLIADVILGRPIVPRIDYEAICNGDETLLGDDLETAEEMDQVIKRFNTRYRPGTIRNVGLITPGYDSEATLEKWRRDPEKFRLLKSTSGKKFHLILLGKLYSFGKKKTPAKLIWYHHSSSNG
jgi:hypothetical protein